MANAAVSAVGFNSNSSLAALAQAAQQSQTHVRQAAGKNGSTGTAGSLSETGRQVDQPGPSRGQAAISAASSSRLRIDLTALGAAISSGDLQSAESAYATVQGDLRNIPIQLLEKTDNGVGQTVKRADMLINLLNSISDAISKAKKPAASEAVEPTQSANQARQETASIDLYA